MAQPQYNDIAKANNIPTGTWVVFENEKIIGKGTTQSEALRDSVKNCKANNHVPVQLYIIHVGIPPPPPEIVNCFSIMTA